MYFYLTHMELHTRITKIIRKEKSTTMKTESKHTVCHLTMCYKKDNNKKITKWIFGELLWWVHRNIHMQTHTVWHNWKVGAVLLLCSLLIKYTGSDSSHIDTPCVCVCVWMNRRMNVAAFHGLKHIFCFKMTRDGVTNNRWKVEHKLNWNFSFKIAWFAVVSIIVVNTKLIIT